MTRLSGPGRAPRRPGAARRRSTRVPSRARTTGWRTSTSHRPEAEVERQSLRRGRPFGDFPWIHETSARLGLEASLRPRGRPQKPTTDQLPLFDGDAAED